MIRSFMVSNYLSIKEPLYLSFVANILDDETSYENYFMFNDERISKVFSFYGMNASGKTNIVKAMAALQETALAISFTPGARFSLPYYPFKFCEENLQKPTELQIEFSLNNNQNSSDNFGSSLYRYSVSYNATRVINEKLEKQTSQKWSSIYHRTTKENGEISVTFGKTASMMPLLGMVKDSVTPNRTYLSLFNMIKVPDISEVYAFFQQRLINISPEITRFDDIQPSDTENPNLKRFLIQLLKASDFNIDNYHISKKKQKFLVNGLMGDLPERNALYLEHKVNSKDNSIEYLNESLGTKKMIVLGLRLYHALSRPSVLVVDELESSLHPELTKFIVTLFLDETTNPHNSQLIFSSHETALLDLSLLRRDQISFVYKDEETGETFIHSLQEFKIRKTSNIQKAYLAGRFSTTPDVRHVFLRS